MPMVHEWPEKGQNPETERGSPTNMPSSRGYFMTYMKRSTGMTGTLLWIRYLTTSPQFYSLVSNFITTLLRVQSLPQTP